MDELRDIAQKALGAAAGAAATALGSDTETKGEDRRSEENANSLRWPILAGFGGLAVILLIIVFVLKRR